MSSCFPYTYQTDMIIVLETPLPPLKEALIYGQPQWGKPNFGMHFIVIDLDSTN